MANIEYIFNGISGAYNVHYEDGTVRINVRAGIGWDTYLAEAEAAIAAGMPVRPQAEYPEVFPPLEGEGE